MKSAMTIRLAFGLFVLGAIIAVLPAPAPADEDRAEQVYQRCLKSIVWIVIPEEKGVRMGSGAIIDAKKRLVLTNYHVISDKSECIVMQPQYTKGKSPSLITEKKKYFDMIGDAQGLKGKVLHFQKSQDLALVQVDRLPPKTVPLKLAEKSPRPGASIHSIGSPGASDSLWIYTPGQVRQMGRKEYTTGSADGKLKFDIACNILETTSATNPGDSGGPCLNDRAELIGVTQGYQSGQARSFSYFIDISEVKNFLTANKIELTDQPKDGGLGLKNQPAESTDTAAKEEPSDKTATKGDGTKPNATAGQSDKDEKKAENKLTIAKSLLDQDGKKDAAVNFLKAILKDYPNTKAAKEAQTLLDKLK